MANTWTNNVVTMETKDRTWKSWQMVWLISVAFINGIFVGVVIASLLI